MKKIILLVFILFFATTIAYPQVKKVIVTGKVVLSQPSDYANLQITFQRTVPDQATFIVKADSTGKFNEIVDEGFYNISFKCKGYSDTSFTNLTLYSNKDMGNIVMTKLGDYLTGNIEGFLKKGVYEVRDSLIVQTNKTLTIEKGTIFKFRKNTIFIVNGSLDAKGTEYERIVFTSYDTTEYWGRGGYTGSIYLKPNKSNDPNVICTLNYVTIEKSNGFTCETFGNFLNIDNLIYQNNNRFMEVCYDGSKITRSKIINNKSEYYGGIYFANVGTIMENCIIANNIADTNSQNSGIGGVGDFGWGNGPTLINCIIYGNKANNIGGVALGKGSKIINCFISNNISFENTCGISVSDSAEVINTIISNNRKIKNGKELVSIQLTGTKDCKIKNNLIYSSYQKYDNSGIDFLGKLVRTNYNGDSTDAYGNIFLEPKFVDTANGDFHLANGSPAIDAGLNSSDLPPTDFDGKVRIWDGNEDQNAIVDIGVYEFGAPKYVSAVEEQQVKSNDGSFLSPNPANDFIDINISYALFQKSDIRIFNVLGECVLLKKTKSDIQRIDISHLQPGMYFLRVGERTEKFVKW